VNLHSNEYKSVSTRFTRSPPIPSTENFSPLTPSPVPLNNRFKSHFSYLENPQLKMHLQSAVGAILALIVGISSLAVAGPSGALVVAPSLPSSLVFGLTNPLLTVLAGFAQIGLVNARNVVPGENATVETALTAREEGDLLARQVPGGSTGVICVPVPGQPWYDTSSNVITGQGIPYLDQVTNPCNVGPGPGNCVRVSCSYSAAIYLCNDVSLAAQTNVL
jgi:hypothetical protein